MKRTSLVLIPLLAVVALPDRAFAAVILLEKELRALRYVSSRPHTLEGPDRQRLDALSVHGRKFLVSERHAEVASILDDGTWIYRVRGQFFSVVLDGREKKASDSEVVLDLLRVKKIKEFIAEQRSKASSIEENDEYVAIKNSFDFIEQLERADLITEAERRELLTDVGKRIDGSGPEAQELVLTDPKYGAMALIAITMKVPAVPYYPVSAPLPSTKALKKRPTRCKRIDENGKVTESKCLVSPR
jgi:hypothetical protein